jgi:hypothetical protein
MPDVNESKIQSMIDELKQLGVIVELDIPEINEGDYCSVVYSTPATDVVEIDGVPAPVGNEYRSYRIDTKKRGKLCIMTMSGGRQ